MSRWTLHYEHDDALIRRAVAALLRAPSVRRTLGRTAALAVGAAALLAAAEALPGSAPSTAMRLIMLLPALLLAMALGALALAALAGPWWLSRRLRRLPHRRVTAVLDDDGAEFATAHERYRFAWAELHSVARRSDLWVIRTRAGQRFVLPADAVPPAAADWLAARITSNGPG